MWSVVLVSFLNVVPNALIESLAAASGTLNPQPNPWTECMRLENPTSLATSELLRVPATGAGGTL
jgi:hypothetical protein